MEQSDQGYTLFAYHMPHHIINFFQLSDKDVELLRYPNINFAGFAQA